MRRLPTLGLLVLLAAAPSASADAGYDTASSSCDVVRMVAGPGLVCGVSQRGGIAVEGCPDLEECWLGIAGEAQAYGPPGYALLRTALRWGDAVITVCEHAPFLDSQASCVASGRYLIVLDAGECGVLGVSSTIDVDYVLSAATLAQYQFCRAADGTPTLFPLA